MKSKPLSRHATMARGALIGSVLPLLAVDQKLDFAALLTGVTAANWRQKKTDMLKAIRPKLAQDADIADVARLLDTLDSDQPGVAADPGTTPPTDTPKPGQMLDAVDADPVDDVLEMLRGKISDEDLAAVAAKIKSILNPAADDAPPPDDDAPPGDPADPGAAPANPFANPDMKDKPAMDAVNKIVATALENAKADARKAAEAREAVRPYVGAVNVALDSGEAIYRAALDILGVKTEGVHPTALPAILAAQPKPGSTRTRIAADSAPSSSLIERFPGLG
jgi:hypothetical protein